VGVFPDVSNEKCSYRTPWDVFPCFPDVVSSSSERGALAIAVAVDRSFPEYPDSDSDDDDVSADDDRHVELK